jgi:transposase
MQVKEREPGDRRRPGKMIKSERAELQRDSLRCVGLALEGHGTLDIAAMPGRSRRFVRRWVYAYRDRGLDAVHGDTAPGHIRRLSPEQETRFIERALRGATPEDAVSSLRSTHMRRSLELEFGVPYSLNDVYAILHRDGFPSLSPRPRHPKQDPMAIAKFRRNAPLL